MNTEGRRLLVRARRVHWHQPESRSQANWRLPEQAGVVHRVTHDSLDVVTCFRKWNRLRINFTSQRPVAAPTRSPSRARIVASRSHDRMIVQRVHNLTQIIRTHADIGIDAREIAGSKKLLGIITKQFSLRMNNDKEYDQSLIATKLKSFVYR